ncbi:Cof-type HAD-IIB family hydrolase [Liquorilactobacillus satsumensis]|uniref:Cof-type HAD-IIB family hydrolase n=1 Tax=Liquorilactobacillus satsumensis TaxID=259059 RepID=UPI0021C33EDA|nr:Cof-type HAD-IIB family hydrolase [Liquorilactobacillus satsumensis]MCP9328254.1 HAD family phosphatase [Liquorilactobacillus satsumensis]
MIQIIASDMDGTLLNDHMVISEKNAAAIKKAQAAGVKFVVSTGRGYTEIKPLVKDAGFNCPMITLNGAQVFDESGKLITAAPIHDQLSTKIIRFLKQQNLYFEIVASKGIFSDNKAKRIENFAELLTRVSPETPYKLAVSMAAARLELMNINYIDDYAKLVEDPHTRIFKIVAFSNEGHQVLDPIKKELEKFDALIITSSSSSNIEINHVNAQKGAALQAYADSLNVPMDNVMAIGDNNNDLSMLKLAGVSYAMGNAITEVKKVAKRLTTSNTEDGVGHAIEEVLKED